MSNSESERIIKSLQEINERLDRLKGVEEILPSATNRQAQQVFYKTYRLIAALVGIWILPAGILLAILGFATWNIREYVDESKNAKLEVKEALIEAKAAGIEVREAFKEIRDIQSRVKSVANETADSAKMATAETGKIIGLKNNVERAKREAEEALKRIGSLEMEIEAFAHRQGAEPGIVEERAESGEIVWAYYGARSGDEWSEQHFITIENEKGEKIPPNSIPNMGYLVKATGNVNAREGKIEYEEGKGWVNKPSKGIIRKNDQFKIVEVTPIGSFYWISVPFGSK